MQGKFLWISNNKHAKQGKENTVLTRPIAYNVLSLASVHSSQTKAYNLTFAPECRKRIHRYQYCD
jgi:hypothetical protein